MTIEALPGFGLQRGAPDSEMPSTTDRSSFIEGAQFFVQVDCDGSVCAISLTGDLTGDAIATLERQLDLIGQARFVEAVIDLRGLVSVDEVGASVLVGLQHYIHGRGARIQMVEARSEVAASLAAIDGDRRS